MGQIYTSITQVCISNNYQLCKKNTNDLPEIYEQKDENDSIVSIGEEADIFPQNIIDVTVRTSNLIMKRNLDPWDIYCDVSDLGSGTFGHVKKILLKTARQYRAMKIIPKCMIMEGVDNSTVISEINILKKLDHPNIMKIYEFYEDEENFYIISEYCDQGDLLGKMQKLQFMSEVVVKLLMLQILNAVAYLHSKKVLHGDIKMENILLYSSSEKNFKRFTLLSQDFKKESVQREINECYRNREFSKKTKNYIDNITNYEVKLIDFGCSKIFSKRNHKNLSGIIGTSIYCSPEVIDDNYNEKSDEWSCGVLMYLLLTGQPPFQGKTEEEIFAKIKKGKYKMNLPELKRTSKNCRNLIQKLLTYNPKERISAIEALKHPFFTESFNPENALTANKDLSILSELIKFKSVGKFQEAILAYLALNVIDKTEEKKIREVFRFADRQSTNQLTISEFTDLLKDNHLGEEEINKLFHVIDNDHDEKISYQEFLRAACNKEKLLSEENLKIAFTFFDNEGSGEITWNDINNLIFHGIEMPDEVIDKYLCEAGMKKDKGMNFEEFCFTMREILPKKEELNN